MIGNYSTIIILLLLLLPVSHIWCSSYYVSTPHMGQTAPGRNPSQPATRRTRSAGENPSQRTRDGAGAAHHGRRQRSAQRRTQEAGRREGRSAGGTRYGEGGRLWHGRGSRSAETPSARRNAQVGKSVSLPTALSQACNVHCSIASISNRQRTAPPGKSGGRRPA